MGLKLHRLYAAASFNLLFSKISALRNTPTSSDLVPSERSLNVLNVIVNRQHKESTIMHKFILAFLLLAFIQGCATAPIVPKEEVGIKETMVKPLQSVTAITAGGMHTCALLLDGSLRCWGSNSMGQLGNEAVENASTNPVAVTGISNIKTISAGYFDTCALLLDGKVKCFGIDDTRSEADIKTIDPRTMPKLFSHPTEVKEVSNATAIATGWAHACLILSDGKVKCWGNNSTGQLGVGTTLNSTTPVEVKGVSNPVAITTGVANTCVVLPNGTVKCWGTDSFGGGSTIYGFNSITPIEIKGISNAKTIASGRNHTCALLSDGTVKCWGSNILGQLWNIKENWKSATPLEVEGITNAIAISAGAFHTCALLSDRTIKCWGVKLHSIPEKYPVFSPIPWKVEGIPNAVSIASGMGHAFVLLSDSTVKCWGHNKDGQLGNDTQSEFSSTPVTVVEPQPKDNK
jgi:alpha-tubulin suppressor-like RCC1 family protein